MSEELCSTVLEVTVRKRDLRPAQRLMRFLEHMMFRIDQSLADFRGSPVFVGEDTSNIFHVVLD